MATMEKLGPLFLHGTTLAVAGSVLHGSGFTTDLLTLLSSQPPASILALALLILMSVHAVVAFTATKLSANGAEGNKVEPVRALGMEAEAFDPSKYPLEEIAKAPTDKDAFLAMYPVLKDSLLNTMTQSEMPDMAIKWASEVIEYTVQGGKLNRGVTVLTVHRTLTRANHGRDLTPTEVARASVLGWAIEWLQAFFLVADDIMDDSQTRRGQPCWYLVPKVGMIAINDSFLLESFVFSLLRQHFGAEPYYHSLVELFVKVVQKTVFGQLLDTTLAAGIKKDQVDFSRYNMDTYSRIVKYKTAFYTFYLPVAIGMITSGVEDEPSYVLARNICCKMGEYFQIQDDVLDCYGDPATIGKVGTDIQDNKCSWLVVQALSQATPEQRKILDDNYGRWDDKKVKKIKELFTELKLEELYEKYEEESYKKIREDLDKVTLMPRDVFELLLKKIYKRKL